ncbi:hypothetical protein H9J88_004445 [Escherichia coli]|nr:hypothetical protein [Escherichia coli]
MQSIDSFLSPLCEAIRNEKLKSKQAAFNLYLQEILEAKKTYTWEQICTYINQNTDSTLAVRAYRNMVERAKKKRLSQEKTNNESGVANQLPPQGDKSTQATKEPAIKDFFSQREKERKLEYDASATMAKFEDKYK